MSTQMQMSQSFRRLWQALYTVVGGDRRWLTTPLTSPSRSRQRYGGGKRTQTVTTDEPPSGEDGTRSEEADSSTQEESPEERILEALQANGGRLDQREIPETADLSQSTVSRKLIAMEDHGEVNRYEIGRRKVVFVPGEEPDAFDSPLTGEETPRETPS